MDDAVMTELKRRLANVDRLDVSRYQFINMERLQKAAGATWPAMRNRVFLATRSMIERRVAEDDLIIPCATGYLVIYAALSGKLAEKTTARIRDEMERFFLGDEELAALNVEAFSEQLSLAEFEAALAGSDIEFIDDGLPQEPTEAPMPGPGAPFHRLEYRAVWDARKEAAASYFVVPRSDSETPVFKPDKPEARLEFDLDVLETAALALERLMEAGSRCAIIAPVGFASAAMARARSQYVTAFSRLPEALRPLIWLRLEDAPASAPASIMAETGRILRGQTSHLFVDAGLDALSLKIQAEAGGRFVGSTLSPTLGAVPRADLDRIVALARRSGVTPYLDGVHRHEDLRPTLDAGISLIAGRSIGIFDTPRAPFRLTREALLKRAP